MESRHAGGCKYALAIATVLAGVLTACGSETELSDPAEFPAEAFSDPESAADFTRLLVAAEPVEPCPDGEAVTIALDEPGAVAGLVVRYGGGDRGRVEVASEPSAQLALAIYGPDDGNGWFGARPLSAVGGETGSGALQIVVSPNVWGRYFVAVTATDPDFVGDIVVRFPGDHCHVEGCPGGCDDGDACTEDLCDAETWTCRHVPLPGCVAYCEEGDRCDDGNPCTADRCEPAFSICMHDAISGCQVDCVDAAVCDDGDPCTVDDVCAGLVCAGTPKDCDDGQDCTLDYCVSGHGVCRHERVPDCPVECEHDLECDDGDACTNDACVRTTGLCAHREIPGCELLRCETDAECDDLDVCNGVEFCDPGTGLCTDGEIPDCDDGDPCTREECDPSHGCQSWEHLLWECCHGDGDCDDGEARTRDYCDIEAAKCVHEPVSDCG